MSSRSPSTSLRSLSRDARSSSTTSDAAPYKRLTSEDRWDAQKETGEREEKEANRLLISFVLMLVIGSGNKIFQKLQTVPMYNYPNFLNLLTTFVYMPLSFAYIIPVAKYGLMNGSISQEQLDLPKKPFIIMGGLDSLAGVMQIFAAT